MDRSPAEVARAHDAAMLEAIRLPGPGGQLLEAATSRSLITPARL